MPLFAIDYPEDKPGAGGAAPPAGFRLSQVDGVYVVEAGDQAGADACQAWLDAYDDTAAQREAATLRVKDEAQRRILAVVPLWKQINATARGVELVQKLATTGALTTEEQGEAAASTALFDGVVKPIRAASNLVEADIALMTAVEAHEFDPATSPRWPA